MSFILVLLGVVCFFFILSVVSSVGSWFETRKWDRVWEGIRRVEGHPCKYCVYKHRHWFSATGMDLSHCSGSCESYALFESGKKLYHSAEDLDGICVF